MTKTIEEVAIEFAEQNYFREDDRYSFRENTDRSIEASAYAFEEGAGYIFSLPLASRLTAEEKERVRKEYANTYPNDIDCGIENMLIQDVLERIFGADFFKEGE